MAKLLVPDYGQQLLFPHARGAAAAAALRPAAGGVNKLQAGAEEILGRVQGWRPATSARSAANCCVPPTPPALHLVKYF